MTDSRNQKHDSASRRFTLGLVVAGLVVAFSSPMAHGQERAIQQPAKVAGLPVGIIEEAFASPDATTRRRMFALLAQRIVRNPNARQRLLAADPAEIGSRLARFQYSAEMLETAKGQTTNAAVQDKLTQVIEAIAVARAANE